MRTRSIGRQPFAVGAKDAHGVRAETWGPEESVLVFGWYDEDGREPSRPGYEGRAVTFRRVLVPDGSPIADRDLLVFPDGTFRVDRGPIDYGSGPGRYFPGLVAECLRAIG